MRIALILYHVSATRGGVERVVWTLSQALAARGHEVHLVCHRRDPAGLPAGIAVQEVPAATWSSALRYASFARNVAAFLRGAPFDVTNGFGRTYGHDVVRVGGGSHWEYLLHTKPAMRNPLVRLMRRWNPRDRTILALERRALAPGTCRRVVCVSRRVRDEVKRYFGVPDESLVVIPNGVDVRRFHPADRAARRPAARKRLGIRDDELAALFAGTGFARKGLETAIGACARLASTTPLRLIVAGRDAPGAFRRRAQAAGLGDRIVFLGESPEIESLYAAADFFLLPTRYDPFPNACLEAMACGLPVLTTAVTGVAEILSPGVDGFVVEAEDGGASAAAAIRELLDPARREAVGRAARSTAERHGVEIFVDRMLRVYEEVVALKAAAREQAG